MVVTPKLTKEIVGTYIESGVGKECIILKNLEEDEHKFCFDGINTSFMHYGKKDKKSVLVIVN